MNTIDLDLLIDRLKKILTTQKGTMISNSSYGFDWDYFKNKLLTDETILEFENELENTLDYFVSNSLCSSVSCEVSRSDVDSLDLSITMWIDDEDYNITGNINFTNGVYSEFTRL